MGKKTVFAASGISYRNMLAAVSTGVIIFFAFASQSLAQNAIYNPSFETVNATGTPDGWLKGRWGTNKAVFSYPVSGFEGSAAWVELTERATGDAKWAFREVPLSGGREYRFSDFYQSNADTHITLQYRTGDGTVKYKDLMVAPQSSSWRKAAVRFFVPADAVSGTIFHLINKVGFLATDAYLLEVLEDFAPPPDPGNLVPNGGFESAAQSGLPSDWFRGRWGTNTAVFSYPVSGEDGSKAVRVELVERATGDAKWAFREVPASPGVYTYTDRYRATVESFVTAKVIKQDGMISYIDIGRLPPASGWQTTHITFSLPADAAAITVFHLINQVGSLTLDAVSLKKGVSGLERGIVSLSFDDGWKTTYQNAIPILRQAGYKSTQYIVTERFGFPAYVTREEVLAMEREGHEIASHTRSHPDLTTLSFAEAQAQIRGSKEDLESMEVVGTKTFAYPFGAYSDAIKEQVLTAGYIASVSSDRGFNVKGNTDLYALKRHSVKAQTPVVDIKRWIDTALAERTWLVLTFHNIDESQSEYSAPPAALAEVVDYLKAKNAEVRTVKEVIPLMR